MKFRQVSLPLFWLATESAAWNQITGDDLDTTIRSGQRPTLVAYTYANEHASEAFKHEWITLLEAKTETKIVSVDCSIETRHCQQQDVTSFPTIRLHHLDGRQTRYRGPRKAASISAYLRRSSLPALLSVTTKNLTAFQSIDDVVFIGRFGPGDEHLEAQFTSVSSKYNDRYSFAIHTEGLPHDQLQPSVECYNNLDNEHKSITEFPKLASIETFVKLCGTRLIPELTRCNELSFYETGKSIVHYFAHSDREREAYVAEMRPLARKYDDYLHFVTTDAREYASVVEMMGLGSRGGGISVKNPYNGDVFPYPYRRRAKEKGEAQITAADVEAFLGDIIQGRVETWGHGGQYPGEHDEL